MTRFTVRRAARGAAATHCCATARGWIGSSGAAATPIGACSRRRSAAPGATNPAASSKAAGRSGHWRCQDRASSSASQGGLEARIAAVVADSPARRSSAAVYRAETAPGASSGAPVHGGRAASTATTSPGWSSAHPAATAAPSDTPPTTIGPSLAA